MTTICTVGPGRPCTSRNRTVRMFSPGGKAAVAATKSQNCAVDVDTTKLGSRPASSIVHGAVALTDGSKRQAKSWSAAVTNGSAGSKFGGHTPGTPPPPCEGGPVSHTARLPLPMSREF